ncbi:LysR family transcriptional regulator [unidentified bacterial endosymbiont]|uniref:LysR family transcriptional regulator n=1 Tax=unidentified bacterial endosymbiont TaxID=2355 RepID=UPI0020A05091|nr:LysR family transcriptional regulator [unidentified bacterial endosymbiont]
MFISKKMRYFIVIMEKKSFSSAAEALYITRSPLSKMITEIETFLGGKLFERKHNVLEPTPLAWEIYFKCKPLYDKLCALTSEYSQKNDACFPEVVFDITVPDNFYKTLKMISESESQNIFFKRKVLSYDEILTLKENQSNWLVSFRDLGACAGVNKEQWEGSDLVLLYSQAHYRETQQYPPLYIWKENQTEFLKERFTYAVKDVLPEPRFIEHNYDIPTLLYLVKEGKGMVLFSHKIAAMYKLEGVNMLTIKNYHSKWYVYSCATSSTVHQLADFKKILNKFL